MDDELPVLHWLLRERVAEIFQVLIENRQKELQEFVSWFLGAARRYARYFTRCYKFDSFVAYAYGRPRFALWARLAKEVQDAATSLGIPILEEVRLPAMPRLKEPTRAFSVVTPVRMRRQRLKEIQDQVSDSDTGD